MNTSHRLAIAFAMVSLATLGACDQKAPEPKKADAPEAAKKADAPNAANAAKKAADAPAAVAAVAPAADLQPNPERNAYFGEEHIHTSWSVDAWVMGNRITGPADALKYAQGETIKHPMGYDIKIDTPMDFMGVTDHSEYVGVTREANTPGSYVSKLPEAQPMIMKDPNSTGRAEPGLLVSAQARRRRAGEGAHGPEDHLHRVEGKRQDCRRAKQARQVHRVLLVRVDVDAGQPQPAPQRLLPGLRQGAGLSLQLARLHSPHGTVELDGRAAQGGQRAPRHLAQRQRERRLDVPGRRRQHHRAADRRRLGGRARPQRAPGRDQAGQGAIGDASPAVAERRVRRLRDVSRLFSAFRPTSAASTTSRAATRARRTRTASPCRTRAATTRTSSAWPAAPTRTTPAARTGRTTSTVFTPMRTGRSSGASPACSSAAPWTCGWRIPAG